MCFYSVFRLKSFFWFPLIILQGAEEHLFIKRDVLNKVTKIQMLATSWPLYLNLHFWVENNSLKLKFQIPVIISKMFEGKETFLGGSLNSHRKKLSILPFYEVGPPKRALWGVFWSGYSLAVQFFSLPAKGSQATDNILVPILAKN